MMSIAQINQRIWQKPMTASRVRRSLQQTYNRANQIAAGGECKGCMNREHGFHRYATEENTSSSSNMRSSMPLLQGKLTIGASDDPLEKEADRVADQVMSMPANPSTTTAPLQIQRFSGHHSGQAGTAPPSVERVLASPGRSLEPGLRQDMESRFGYDFSNVRMYSGSAAEQSAKDVNANAYTVGRNIVFGAGRLETESGEGRRLIAHELTHIVQQLETDNHMANSKIQIQAVYPDTRIQRSERDPDELAEMAKEDEAIKQLAKQAQASRKATDVKEVIRRLIKSHRLEMHVELKDTRYDSKQNGVSIELSDEGPRTRGAIVVGDAVLRDIASDPTKVVSEIKTEISKVDRARETVDYVFIMGADKPKTHNKFYTAAKEFFKAQYPDAEMIEDVRDLEGINRRINTYNKPVANLYIVSHAHPDGTLQFNLFPSKESKGGHITYSELKEANDKNRLTQPNPDLVGFWTNIVIRGCSLGRAEEMLQETQKAFGGKAQVIAPTHEQAYGGGREKVAAPFYEEPGISKLTKDQAFERIKAKPEYRFITDWKAMRKRLERTDMKPDFWVWSGRHPQPGKESEYLKKAQNLTTTQANKYAFQTCRPEGTNSICHYVLKPQYDERNISYDVPADTPPTPEEAVKLARQKVATPDSYKYEVHKEWDKDAVHLNFHVFCYKTEWELHHADIHKRGKSFSPSLGTKIWFGDIPAKTSE